MIEILAKAGQALLTVLVVGVVLGAGLPALYAAGMRALVIGRELGPDGEPVGKIKPTSLVIAGLCFAVVLAAIIYGILIIVFGKKVLP